MPYAMGDINTAAAFADFGNSLFMERCGVQATVWGFALCAARWTTAPWEIDPVASALQ